MANKRDAASPEGTTRLRIGAVSRLTQIPVDTLRAWERRYGVVAPERAGSTARLYDQEDVERLKLIKRLVENDHAIGSVATLPRPELEGLLAQHGNVSPTAPHADGDVGTVLAYGDAVPPLDVGRASAHGVTVLGQYTGWAEFESAVLERQPEALVIEMATLAPDRVDDILRLAWRSSARRTIVLYGFAPRFLVERLEGEGLLPLHSNVGPGQLLRELRRRASRPGAATGESRPGPGPRLFADAALAEIALQPAAIRCECPHHLVTIIRTLAQFERYSAECEHRNDDDAVLHAMLRATTAHARSLMERALFTVAEAEGIALPASVRDAARDADA